MTENSVEIKENSVSTVCWDIRGILEYYVKVRVPCSKERHNMVIMHIEQCSFGVRLNFILLLHSLLLQNIKLFSILCSNFLFFILSFYFRLFDLFHIILPVNIIQANFSEVYHKIKNSLDVQCIRNSLCRSVNDMITFTQT